MSLTSQIPAERKRPRYSWTIADLLAALLIAGFGISFFILQNSQHSSAAKGLIRKSGAQLSTFSLESDDRIDLKQFGVNMVVEVRDGRVRVLSSDCNQQLCVRHGWIEHPKEAIFCLPNHTTVELSGESAQYDAISR